MPETPGNPARRADSRPGDGRRGPSALRLPRPRPRIRWSLRATVASTPPTAAATSALVSPSHPLGAVAVAALEGRDAAGDRAVVAHAGHFASVNRMANHS